MSPTRKSLIENARILVVDDRYADVVLIKRILGADGYCTIASVDDSRQVIDRFRTFQPDLVIVDLWMSKAVEVISQLRGWISEETYLPILVLTADASQSTRQKALSLGVHDFLMKPVNQNEVLLRVYNLLQTRWLYRQIQSQNRSLMEQVRISRHELDAAQAEIGQLLGGHVVAAGLLAALRIRIVQAVSIIDRLAETAEKEAAPHRISN